MKVEVGVRNPVNGGFDAPTNVLAVGSGPGCAEEGGDTGAACWWRAPAACYVVYAWAQVPHNVPTSDCCLDLEAG